MRTLTQHLTPALTRALGTTLALGLLAASLTATARASEYPLVADYDIYAVAARGNTIPECCNWWGYPVGLLPESEWRNYVGRPAAFGAGSPDPARMPVLTRQQARRAAPARKTVAQAPKPDPCAEKVWQAFDEAARAGTIPASAVPPRPGTVQQPQAAPHVSAPGVPILPGAAPGQQQFQPQGQPMSQATPQYLPQSGPQAGLSPQGVPGTPQAPPQSSAQVTDVTVEVQVTQPGAAASGGGVYTSQSSSTAPPGTSAHGIPAPNPVMGRSAAPPAPLPPVLPN